MGISQPVAHALQMRGGPIMAKQNMKLEQGGCV